MIVINYGCPDLTVRFVREECPKIQEEHRVVVVDNASTDETYGALVEALPAAVILRSADNQGFARANNQGADYALAHFRPAYILFSNNDVFFRDAGVVDALVRQMASHPGVGIMGPQVLGLDGERQSPNPLKTFAQKHLLPTWGKLVYRPATLRGMLLKDYSRQAQEGPCGWVSGACFLVDAQAFRQAGGFDPATFLYGEEQILSARFARIGRSVYFYPSVSVIHQHGAVTSSHFDELQIRKMVFRSDCHYYRTYTDTPSWQILLGKFTLWMNVLRGK